MTRSHRLLSTKARPSELSLANRRVAWETAGSRLSFLFCRNIFRESPKSLWSTWRGQGRQTVFFTRRELGLDNLDKLRMHSGLRIGAQAVGHGTYYVTRLFAYVFGLREPKWVTGYTGPE